jgi:hypothetical protein
VADCARARTALALSLDLCMDFPPCHRTKNLLPTRHIILISISLHSLSLSTSSPLSLLPLLYFSFLSKRRKGLVLTFSSPPPPSPLPPHPLPFHHSAFGSPIPVVSSSTPYPPPPVCAVFVVYVRGACFRHCRYYISYISNLSQKYGFCFCFGLTKSTPFFFCFLSFIIMACLWV